jgi:LysM repeat protein
VHEATEDGGGRDPRIADGPGMSTVDPRGSGPSGAAAIGASSEDGPRPAGLGPRPAGLDPRPAVDPVAELRRELALQVCPFLDPAPGAVPSGEPVDARCMAHAGDPWALSDRQRTLVCISETHLECPRYRRAAMPDQIAPPAPRRRVPRATLVAVAVLGLSLAAAVGSLAMNGGIGTPIASPHPTPSPGAAASARPTASAGAASAAPTAASQSPAASGPIPTGSIPTPTAAPSLEPSPATSPSPGPTSDRYALLVACPGKPDCFTYTVRAGDNLTSIGLYFGVPFDTILRLNPWILDPSTIHRGQVIVLPPPTR